MAAPNIVNVTTITGTTSVSSLSTTSNTSIASNAASSNQVWKINNVIVANVNGTNACNFSLFYNSAAAGGGSNTAMASTISIPANASLIALDKSTAIYLPENTSLTVTAGTANVLTVTVSYEIIS
jgi:glucose dehydrogenase